MNNLCARACVQCVVDNLVCNCDVSNMYMCACAHVCTPVQLFEILKTHILRSVSPLTPDDAYCCRYGRVKVGVHKATSPHLLPAPFSLLQHPLHSVSSLPHTQTSSPSRRSWVSRWLRGISRGVPDDSLVETSSAYLAVDRDDGGL